MQNICPACWVKRERDTGIHKKQSQKVTLLTAMLVIFTIVFALVLVFDFIAIADIVKEYNELKIEFKTLERELQFSPSQQEGLKELKELMKETDKEMSKAYAHFFFQMFFEIGLFAIATAYLSSRIKASKIFLRDSK